MKFVSYLRVSTQRQGQSGVDLAAQQAAVANYVQGRGDLVDEIQEIESGPARQLSQRAMVTELNSIGVPAPRGGTWLLRQVQRLLTRLHAH